jgi:predicted alpha/beta superfamily hydrolase
MSEAQLVIDSIDSPALGRKRKIRAWLPPGYDPTHGGGYPVIYASDAQMKFSDRDEDLPYGSWGLDEWLIRLGVPVVVVAVDNSPQRMKEYNPFTEEFARYEKFLVEELVPYARERFGVASEPNRVAHIGSSMGGILSCAIAINNPGVFGNALCLSPWFEIDRYRYIYDVLKKLDAKPPLRIYLDSGIQDWRMQDDGHRGTMDARLEFLRMGFEEGYDLDWVRDTFFPTLADFEGSAVKEANRQAAIENQHTEFHWRRRLERPLRFFYRGFGR